MPTSFGAFFPNGSYVGWRDDLKKFFESEMPVEQKALFESAGSYQYCVISKFIGDPGRKVSDCPPSSPIAAHEPPRQLVLDRAYKALGSLITTENQILAVDEALKETIERFEAGLHQFFPLDITMRCMNDPRQSSVTYPARFFILVIGQYIDSFLPEQSAPNSWRYGAQKFSGLSDPDQTFFFGRDKNSMSGLALSKQGFGGAHLWIERRMPTPLICLSDVLLAEINRLGLRLPRHTRLKEI